MPRGSGWKAAGRKPSSCRGDAPLPLQGPRLTRNLGAGGEGRGGGRLRPLPARHHLPRGGREVTGKGGGLAAQLLTSRPTASPAGPRPRPRASCLPPPTRPAARWIPRGRPAPRAALGAAARGRRGAQPSPRARRHRAAATERLLAREHVSRKRARSRPEFPTAGRARARREAASTLAINARPTLIPPRPRPPPSSECPGSFQGWFPTPSWWASRFASWPVCKTRGPVSPHPRVRPVSISGAGSQDPECGPFRSHRFYCCRADPSAGLAGQAH